MKKSKKICITGGCGFIGSYLSEFLIQKGYQVLVLDKYNINNHYGWLENSKFRNEINFKLGDIRDYDYVEKVLGEVDSCVHLAALIGIPYSYVTPIAYLKTNLEGTYNVLQASLKKNVNKVIIASTSEVYGSAEYLPIDEKHPIKCQSPYSASKASADQLSLSYYRSFGLPVKIVRPFNTYGPRQSLRAIIPTLITQFLQNKKTIEVGNIKTERDFTYVEDTISGIYEIFNNNQLFGEITNIGSGKSISIKKLINLLQEIFDRPNIKIKINNSRIRPAKSEVSKLECDNSKITKKTNWKPKVTLENGLKKTSSWLEDNIYLFKNNIYNI